jgi:hypothetical protein
MKITQRISLGFVFLAMVIAMILPMARYPANSATVTTGVTFTTNQLVQYYDLNNAINNASVSDIGSGDITDGTIANVDLGANAVTTQKVLDGTLLGTDMANRTILGINVATNAIDGIGLSSNIVFRSGDYYFTNINTTVKFNGPSTTLSFASNQINWAAVSGVTNSAGAADAGKVVKLNDSGILDSTFTPFTKSFVSAAQTITAGGALTIAHSMGGMPTLVQARIKCTSGDMGYSVGDELIIPVGSGDAGGNTGISVVTDATNLVLRYGSAATSIQVLNKGTGNVGGITDASWQLYLYAWR